MSFNRYTPFPDRLLAEIGLSEFQIFIAQVIEGNFFVSDGLALVPVQAVFLFPLKPESSRFGVSRHLPLPQALEGDVDIPAVLSLFIFDAKRFSHVSPRLERVTFACALPSGT